MGKTDNDPPIKANAHQAGTANASQVEQSAFTDPKLTFTPFQKALAAVSRMKSLKKTG